LPLQRTSALPTAEQDARKGSELAEIVLYGIMRHKYGALPVVPKIFYKQNTQDNAKGADSVHIVLNPDEDFSLWFGEAKFYSSIEDARLGSIIESVKTSLGTEKLKKENAIIVNLPELDHLNIEVAPVGWTV
jgi:Cap4 SAVED domain